MLCCETNITYKNKELTNYTSLELENYLLFDIIQRIKKDKTPLGSTTDKKYQEADKSNELEIKYNTAITENKILKRLLKEMKIEKIETLTASAQAGDNTKLSYAAATKTLKIRMFRM